MLKNRQTEKQIKPEHETMQMIEYKENILKKIFNKIKSFFRIKYE